MIIFKLPHKKSPECHCLHKENIGLFSEFDLKYSRLQGETEEVEILTYLNIFFTNKLTNTHLS